MLRIALCVALVVAGIVAQQPNSGLATLDANGTLSGPPFPVPVGGLQGTTVTLNLAGGPMAVNMPFAAAIGPVVPGFAVFPQGILDLDASATSFAVVLDGFNPGSPTSAIAVLDGLAQFQLSFFNGYGLPLPHGIQAAVSDPTAATGARMTAALDFAPVTAEPLAMYIGGTAAPVWSNNGGVVSVAPTCSSGVFLNNDLSIMFGDTVDPMSLPAPGPAFGSINIYRMTATGTEYASGRFVVLDDPRLPVGNQRVVMFLPDIPTTAASCGGAGLAPSSTYTVFVPDVSLGGPVVSLGAVPLQTSLLTCFTTQPCNAANPVAAYMDLAPGGPRVVSTTPLMTNPPPAPILSSSIFANTVSVTFNEELLSSNIDLTTVRLVNTTMGNFQVPGTVTYTGPGGMNGAGSRIDYTAALPLSGGSTFRFEVDVSITDVVGNPVELVPGSPGMPLFLATQGAAPVPQPPIVESFTNPATAATVGPFLAWNGGALSIAGVFGSPIAGTGAFGPLTFNTGPSTLDTGAAPTTGYAMGVWQASLIMVNSGALVRMIGPYGVTLRSTGPVTISGVLNGSAGMSTTVPLGSPERGPGAGSFNNGGAAVNAIVNGGVAGVGGGDGGRASQAGYTVRTVQGESGFGPTIAGAANPGPIGTNPFFGGGTGGVGGFRFPAGGIVGDLGGQGGAGGSAWAPGLDGGPRTVPGTGCTPYPPPNQAIAFAAPVPAVMVTPINMASAGSGGGGGGDRWEVSGPTNDDQGAGGGGGGGGLYIGAVGDVNINAGAVISLDGAGGGIGNLFFGGGGGGGSGGELWIQTQQDLNINSMALLSVQPGPGANPCSDHASGAGGIGLCQLEDSDGVVNTSFLTGGMGPAGANVVVLQVPIVGNAIQGTAVSVFYDTGFTNPTFTSVIENFVTGTMGTVSILYEGAQASVANPNQPDLSTLTLPATGNTIGTLSGNRFIRMTITLTYPVIPVGNPVPPLPQVNDVTINFSA